MKTVLLGDVSKYVTEKVSVQEISLEDYVSTENLVPEKGGLVLAANLPQSGKVTRFEKNDVLVSNIRPYFKKIWFANRNGGASNDVLVFRPSTDDLSNEYLRYILADDSFFDYSTASSGGSKMPRGDKAQILKYSVYLPDAAKQKRIAEMLSDLDKKIELNRRMNETLEKIGQALFKHYFIDNPEAKIWDKKPLDEICSQIVRGFTAKYADSSNLINLNQKVNRGPYLDKQHFKYYEPETVVPVEKFVRNNDVLINSLGQGTLGRVHLYSEQMKNVVVDQHITIVRSSINHYLYYLLAYFDNDRLQSVVSGTTGMLMLNVNQIRNFEVAVPADDKKLEDFLSMSTRLHKLKSYNSAQNENLVKIRDLLLPRLISGKIKV